VDERGRELGTDRSSISVLTRADRRMYREPKRQRKRKEKKRVRVTGDGQRKYRRNRNLTFRWFCPLLN